MSDQPEPAALSEDGSVFGADEQRAVPVDVARWVRLATLVLVEERVAPETEMSLLFVDEPTIARLNEQFLGEARPTDVLAFPLDDEPPPSGRRPDHGGRGPGAPGDDEDPPTLLGDVVVCPSVARRNAQERGVALDDELALLVVHGVLHLLNYDHAEAQEQQVMQRRERELLARFGELEGR